MIPSGFISISVSGIGSCSTVAASLLNGAADSPWKLRVQSTVSPVLAAGASFSPCNRSAAIVGPPAFGVVLLTVDVGMLALDVEVVAFGVGVLAFGVGMVAFGVGVLVVVAGVAFGVGMVALAVAAG
jgi:hypothetical protein